MIELKILNWMLKGNLEISLVYRSIEFQLLQEAFDRKYKLILKNIDEYYSRYKAPPSISVLSKMLDGDDVSRLSLILDDECLENEINFYIDQAKNKLNKHLAKELSRIIDASDDNLANINNNIKNVFLKVERLGKNAVFSEGNMADSVEERMNDYLFTKENPNNVMGVFSGYKALDDYTWGIKNSEMMIISGATSSGKSLLMMNMAINAWLGDNNPSDFNGKYFDNGKNVVYVTLEMSKKQLEQRVDANIARIKQRSIMRGQLVSEEMNLWKRSLEFQKNYDKKFYVIDMPRGTKTIEIEAKFDAIASQFKPDLICVDYLGIMKPNKSYGSDWEDIGHIAEDLHEFCRKKNIPLITAAQRKARVRAAGKGKAESVEDSEEIGRSKMVGDNANIILLIENRNEEHLREDMVIHVVKNRDGAKGKFFLLKEFDKSRAISAPENWASDEDLENEV
jgi:replicative DNA helicase